MEQLSLIQDSIDNLSKHMPEGEYIQLMNATKTIYNTIKKKPKKIIIYRKKTSFAKQIIGPYVYRKFNYNDLITISWKGELYLRDLNYAIYHFKRFIDGALQIGNYIQNNHSFILNFSIILYLINNKLTTFYFQKNLVLNVNLLNFYNILNFLKMVNLVLHVNFVYKNKISQTKNGFAPFFFVF